MDDRLITTWDTPEGPLPVAWGEPPIRPTVTVDGVPCEVDAFLVEWPVGDVGGLQAAPTGSLRVVGDAVPALGLLPLKVPIRIHSENLHFGGVVSPHTAFDIEVEVLGSELRLDVEPPAVMIRFQHDLPRGFDFMGPRPDPRRL